jgi:hypothetical protein
MDEVGEADLGGRPRQADGPDEQAHPGLLLGKDVLDVGARTADLFAFALAVRGGIGRLVGFFRWMWLVSIRWRSKASFFLER